MALVSVLWILALLTVFATIVTSRSLTSRRVAQRYLETAQTELVCDGAIRLAMFRLMAALHDHDVSVARAETVNLQDILVDVRISLESGRVDLNTASPTLIMEALVAFGMTTSNAEALTKIIVDRGNTDHASKGGYGGRSEEKRAGSRGFETIDELRRIIHVQANDLDILDAFTVYTHSSEPVWPEASPRLRDHSLTGRSSGALDLLTKQQTEFIRPEPGVLFRVRSCVLPAGTSRCRQAIIRLTGNDRQPWEIFNWESVDGGVNP